MIANSALISIHKNSKNASDNKTHSLIAKTHLVIIASINNVNEYQKNITQRINDELLNQI